MTDIVVARQYGGPEVLELEQSAMPVPGPGQVRIEVRAAGVNPFDVKVYSGTMGDDPRRLPMRLGNEAAGVVTAVGDGVTSVAVGDEVIAYPAPGAYASDLLVSADALTPKPSSLPWAEAGGLMLAGVTAVHALTAADVAAEETVLIHGASGGVGLMAIQLAVLRGARVIATASRARHDLLSSFGVTPVAYGPGLADRVRELAPDGVDAALDLVGSDEAVQTSLELVSDRQRIVTIAAFGRAEADGIVALGGGPGADPGTAIRAAARGSLAELAGSGSLRVLVAATYSLALVADAHAAIGSGHSTGKLVLIP